MKRIAMIRLLGILVMLLSIAGGPTLGARSGYGDGVTAKAGCCRMACCAVKEKLPAEEKPAPVQQRVGQELAAPVLTAPFGLLFTVEPTEARRAPRELFAGGHGRAPLAVSCIRLV